MNLATHQSPSLLGRAGGSKKSTPARFTLVTSLTAPPHKSLTLTVQAEQQAWRWQHRDGAVMQEIAEAYVAIGSMQCAERYLKRAVQSSKHPSLLRLLGNTLAKLHDYPAAVFWYDKCLELLGSGDECKAVEAERQAVLMEEGRVPEAAGVLTPMDGSPDLPRMRDKSMPVL